MNNELRIKIWCICFLFIIAVVGLAFIGINCVSEQVVFAEKINVDEKVYPQINIEDDFLDDSIVVVLDKEETFKFIEYSPKNFSGIECIDVRDLMEFTKERVEQQLKAQESNNWKELESCIENNMLIDLNNYRRILKITLKEKSKEAVIKAIDMLMEMPGIKTAEPNYIQKLCADHPNAENLRYQWALDNINVNKAWDRSIGNSSVKVGILDTGIDGMHPDLYYRVVRYLCADFTNDESTVLTPNPTDPEGHGTHVAGIIGAQGIDDGISGVCQDVSLVSLRVFNNGGYNSRVISAIDYAISNNIYILNFSGGGDGAYSSTYKQALLNYPGLFICSAGNDNRDTDLNPHYPSQYTTESNRIISVGAIDSNNTKRASSNFGATTVDLFAPGGAIISTWPTSLISSGYNSIGGTSMATPYVTGVAALMKAYNPLITAEQMKSIIVNNVDYVEALDGLCASNGKLNAGKVLNATFQTKEVFNGFGYEGEEFYWRGKVDMTVNSDVSISGSSMPVFHNNEDLYFEVKEVNSYNLVLVMDGTMTFSLKNSSGTIVQPHTATASVNLLNQSSLSNATFSIDTGNLPVDTYTLTLTSHFTRGPSYYEDHTLNYKFAVNRSIEVMNGFGYLSSWYQWKGNVELSNEYLYSYSKDSSNRYIVNKNNTDLDFEIGTTLAFNAVKEMTGSVTMTLVNSANETVDTHYCSVRVGLVSNVTLSSRTFTINTSDYSNDTYTINLSCTMTRNGTTYNNSASYSFVLSKPSSGGGGSCITTGSLITLADGTQTAVENLTGNEQLLVWDMLNGTFTSAPILFIDSEITTTYDVITLTFSDNTQLEVIDEHAFFDTTLNKYVFLRSDAAQYIGHWFKKQSYDINNDMILTNVQLVSVNISQQITTAYSPVTYGHLCYYVNGMLSMPGNTESFINIFDVDAQTMAYDQTSMAQDIATYGLYTYAEFNSIIPIPELVFNAFNGQYLKIAIGKGITTLDEIQALLERYSVFFE